MYWHSTCSRLLHDWSLYYEVASSGVPCAGFIWGLLSQSASCSGSSFLTTCERDGKWLRRNDVVWTKREIYTSRRGNWRMWLAFPPFSGFLERHTMWCSYARRSKIFEYYSNSFWLFNWAKATSMGFEPTRAEFSSFWVHRLSHSATVSLPETSFQSHK